MSTYKIYENEIRVSDVRVSGGKLPKDSVWKLDITIDCSDLTLDQCIKIMANSSSMRTLIVNDLTSNATPELLDDLQENGLFRHAIDFAEVDKETRIATIVKPASSEAEVLSIAKKFRLV